MTTCSCMCEHYYTQLLVSGKKLLKTDFQHKFFHQKFINQCTQLRYVNFLQNWLIQKKKKKKNGEAESEKKIFILIYKDKNSIKTQNQRTIEARPTQVCCQQYYEIKINSITIFFSFNFMIILRNKGNL